MKKLKRVLVAAAGLILGGLAVSVALKQAGQDEGMTCPQWCKAIDRVRDVQAQRSFFVAVQQGADIPEAAGDRVLGDCAGGTCTIAPAPPCDHCAYTYSYDCGPLVSGWRICEVKAHPYFAEGWKLAAEDQVDLHWYQSFGQVIQDARAHFTGAQILNLLDAGQRCFKLETSTGEFCRHGRLFGPGKGGDDPCPYARLAACQPADECGVMPCTTNRGAGSEMTDATRVWTDQDFDDL